MKESRLFSPRLFWEGFRQLKIPGVLMTIFYTLIVIMEPMSSLSRYYLSSYWDYEPWEVNFHDMFYLLDYTAFLIVPVLIFWIFHFMMKRSTSDFYHALPVSRVCLTMSLFVSAVAWMTIILLVQMVVGILIYALYPAVFWVEYGSLLPGLWGRLAVGILSGGYALLALSLTGTMLSGMVTVVLLPYLPLCAAHMVYLGLEEGYYHYHLQNGYKGSGSAGPTLANLRAFINNFEDFLELNLMNLFDEPKHSVWQILFTLLLGVVVVWFAVFMMRYRKSETAGKSAVNHGVHIAIRISGTLFILWFLGVYVSGSLTIFTVVLALVAYLAYELLTTRRWSKVLRSLIWLPVVVLLMFIPYWCGYGITMLF